MKIGKDVLKKSIPSKAEITLKAPSPFDIIQLKLQWEREENRRLSDEEIEQRLRKYIRQGKLKRNIQERKSKSKSTKKPYV